jgi:[protein-PII] uridylyltransferase
MSRTVRKRQEIIDSAAGRAALDELLGWSGYSTTTQPKVLALLKDVLARGRDEIRRRFVAERVSGGETVRAQAFLIDEVIGLIQHAAEHVYPLANPTKGEQLSIVATGGYGRGTLAPYSDIDLMFLLPYKQTPRGEQVVEFILYRLWDLGLKVGHATRTVDEAIRYARDDIMVRTSVLECRFLLGEKALFEDFRARFFKEVVEGTGPDYVEAKLAERDVRHERMGDTRYVLEPNIKEGKGGLRDLNTLFWIAKYLYQVDTAADLVAEGVFTRDDARLFAKAENFLWTVRYHLHDIAGRPEERLTFDVQPTIGERLGYTDRAGVQGVERFMKHYFLVAKDIGDLTRVLCAVLEEHNKKRQGFFSWRGMSRRSQEVAGFQVDNGRLIVEDGNVFEKAPVRLLTLFHAAQAHDLDIHPNALRLVSQNLNLIDKSLRADPEANRLFVDMMTSPIGPRVTLTRLNEAGVLGRFVPDFGRIVAQMQFDMYHVYTVDEHTIRALDILHGIEFGRLSDEHPVSSHVIHEVQSRRVLYVALFLHDIAKGRGGNHSILGEGIANRVGPRFGLEPWETETVAWLVRNHLVMSDIAFKRDLDDPKTISDFIEIVQSPERLRLLLVLTVADIRAVGPGVWNGWKAALLRELYYRAVEVMTGGAPDGRVGARVDAARDKLRERLREWTGAEIDAHLARGYDAYWLTFDTKTHEHHARTVREAEKRGLDLHIETSVDHDRDVTEILVYTPDHPGLFSRIAGAMALSGANIVDAKITTLANGMALDSFSIQDADGGSFDCKERLSRLWSRIEAALSSRLHIRQELADMGGRGSSAARARAFHVAPRVLIDNRASGQHTVIEVNGRDRPGFLYDVTAALTQVGLQIASAHIATYGERAVDVFYVKDVFGLRIERPEQIERIRVTLLAAVAQHGAEDSPSATDRRRRSRSTATAAE